MADEGYAFKKGKSRSKQSHVQEDAPNPKRQKSSASFRTKHIGELEEDIKDLTDRLQFKEKMRDQATMARNYKLCDQLTEEMSAIKKKKREREQELHMWNRNFVDITNSKALSVVNTEPPSAELKKLFSKVNGAINDDLLENAAKDVLLPTEECRIWIKHLMTVLENRRRGARKAAETRKNRSQNVTAPSQVSSKPGEEGSEAQVDESEEDSFCGDCGQLYQEETDEPEVWIECGLCNQWFHCTCEGLSSPPPTEAVYICLRCQH